MVQEPWLNGSEQLVNVDYTYWTLSYILSGRGAKKLIDGKPLGENLCSCACLILATVELNDIVCGYVCVNDIVCVCVYNSFRFIDSVKVRSHLDRLLCPSPRYARPL